MKNTKFQLTLNDIGAYRSIIYCSISSFLVFILACGRSLFSAYTPDDYLVNAQKLPFAFFLQQGRFVQGTIAYVFDTLNLSLTSTGFAFGLLLFATVSLSVSLFLYYLADKKQNIYVLTFASALIVSHPIFSTLTDYHQTLADYTVAFICLSGFFYFSKTFFDTKQYKYLIYAAIALSLTCGAYQPCLPVATIWCLFYAFLQNKNYKISNLIIFFLPVICGVIVYILLYALTKNAGGANNWDSRVGIVAIHEIKHRLHDVKYFVPSVIWREWWIIPSPLTLLLSAIVGLVLLEGLALSFKKYVIILILFVLTILIIIGPISIVKTWDPTHRALLGFAFCYGLILNFNINNSFITKFLLGCATLAIIFSISVSNSFLAHVEHTNSQDQWIASNISLDLLKHGSGQKIVIVNGSTLNTVDWAYQGVFYTHTGHRFNFQSPTTQDKAFCEKSVKWPKDGYLHINDQQLTVCLN